MKARRLIAVFTLAGMLVSGLGFAEGGGGTILSDSGTIYSMAHYGSTLSIFTHDTLYLWDEATGETTAHPIGIPLMDDARLELGEAVAGADGVYALTYYYATESSAETLGEVRLCPVLVGESGAATLGEGIELDWDGLIVMEGISERAIEARNPVIAGDTLAFLIRDAGRGARLAAFDLKTGECAIHALSADWDVGSLCAYRDGRLLLSAWNWRGNASELYAVEPMGGDFEAYCALPASDEARGLVYDAANDLLYYALGGSLFAMDGRDSGAARELAATPFGGNRLLTPALTADGRYLCGDGARVIALSPAGTGERARLTVNAFDSYLIEEALPAFAQAHPDVEVALLQDYPDPISAMMTQSSAVDIYILDADSQEYGALLDRGYLAELSGSAALTELVSGMYPVIRDAVTREGELVALPIRLDAYQLTANLNALKKLGLAREDLPATWLAFLGFLREFPERARDCDVTAFEPYFSAEDLKSNLLAVMLGEYLQDYAAKGGAFDAEGLRALLLEFDAVDFEALTRGGATADWESAYENSLFVLYGQITCEVQMYGYAVDPVPMPLALREGEAGALNGHVTVAVVNPYCENRALAIAFLEEFAARFPVGFLYDTCPGRSEPVRIDGYGETAANIEADITAAQAELEKADEKDKKAWEDRIASRKRDQDAFLNVYSWLLSPDSIARYREAAQGMRISRYLGLGRSNDFAFSKEIIRYLDGAMSADEFAQAVAGAIEMSLLEGK